MAGYRYGASRRRPLDYPAIEAWQDRQVLVQAEARRVRDLVGWFARHPYGTREIARRFAIQRDVAPGVLTSRPPRA